MTSNPNPNSLGGRIERLMQEKRIKVNALAKLVELSGQGMRDILSGKSENPKVGVIIKLARLFEVSTDWLLMGEQSMAGYLGYELAEPSGAYSGGRPGVPARVQRVPFISLRAQFAFAASGGELTNLPELQTLSLPDSLRLEGDLCAFEVEDDSLAPEFRQGALVIGALETTELRYIPSGHVYAVLFAGSLRVMRLNVFADAGFVELRGSDPQLPPLRVAMSDVAKLWRIRFVMNRV